MQQGYGHLFLSGFWNLFENDGYVVASNNFSMRCHLIHTTPLGVKNDYPQNIKIKGNVPLEIAGKMHLPIPEVSNNSHSQLSPNERIAQIHRIRYSKKSLPHLLQNCDTID